MNICDVALAETRILTGQVPTNQVAKSECHFVLTRSRAVLDSDISSGRLTNWIARRFVGSLPTHSISEEARVASDSCIHRPTYKRRNRLITR